MPVAPTHTRILPRELVADLITTRPIRTRIDVPLAVLLSDHGLAARAVALAEEIDDDAVGVLRANARIQKLQGLAAAGAAARVGAALDGAGIPALVFKGPATSVTIGEGVADRPAADVDVLVAPEAVADSHSVLTGLGYQHLVRHRGVPWRIEQHVEFERTYEADGPHVDLHWEVDDRRPWARSRFDPFWDRRQQLDVGGGAVWGLGNLDSFLVCALHGSREQWRKGKWVVDAGRLWMRLAPQERAEMNARAASLDCAVTTRVTVWMLEALIGGRSSSPEDVKRAAALTEQAFVWALSGPEDPRKGRGEAAGRRSWRWRNADSLADAAYGLAAASARRHLPGLMTPRRD